MNCSLKLAHEFHIPWFEMETSLRFFLSHATIKIEREREKERKKEIQSKSNEIDQWI